MTPLFASFDRGRAQDAASACPVSTDDDTAFRDGELLVFADARIDDRARLVANLADACHVRRDAPAALLIAAAWRHWGRDCPHHLLGDYAFVVYDAAQQILFCARDHVGARPLFYTADASRFACASRIDRLLDLPHVSAAIDKDFAATALFDRRFEPHDRSFYQAIRRLPAGHSLTVTATECAVTRWWRPENIAVDKHADDAATLAQFRDLLDAAVDDRLAGADRIAIHLSGGLDSSAIAALATPRIRASGRPDPIGYSWHEIRADADADEEPGWSEAIRAALDLNLFAPISSAEELADLLAADWTRQPDSRNLFHESAIQRDAAARGVSTILSGWGGDEAASFNGRGHHPHLFATGRWAALYRDRDRPGAVAGVRTVYRAGRQWFATVRPRLPKGWKRQRGKSLIAPAFLRRAHLLPVARLRETSVRAAQMGLLHASSMTARLEDWALSGHDHGIEYRYPLLDRRLMEFAYSLPPRMFKRNGMRRWLMRTATKDLIPDVVRLNSVKSEPIRCNWLERHLAQAYAIVRARLTAAAEPPARAAYVDMAALMARLKKAEDNQSGRDQALRLAVQFLDIS